MSDYERELRQQQIDEMRLRIAELEAQVAELTARLLDQEGD
jgi:hypothetical protein